MSFWSNLFADVRIGGVLAVAIGLGILIAVAFYAWRVLGSGIRRNAGRGSRPPRLALVDAFDLDRHRQLVIIRRDNVEHLIMIGGPNDLVIEQAIVRAQPAGAERREPSNPLVGGETSRAPAVEVKTPIEPPSPPMAPAPLRPAIEPEALSGKPPVVARPAPTAPLAPPRPPASSAPAAVRPAPVMPPPLRPAPPPRPPLGAMPAPSAEPTIVNPQPPPPPSGATEEMISPPPIVQPPAPPPSETLVEATRPPPPRADQLSKEIPRFAVNIDSLEEEMAKLLGRPQDQTKKS
jgi:flagellar protein FliO/FliZ